jgi:hypothetical protein
MQLRIRTDFCGENPTSIFIRLPALKVNNTISLRGGKHFTLRWNRIRREDASCHTALELVAARKWWRIPIYNFLIAKRHENKIILYMGVNSPSNQYLVENICA